MTGPARLVFVGDSITDAGRDRDDAASLGDGYVSLVARDLSDVEVVNLGVGGDRAVDVERRWQAEVAPAAADVLTVYVGVNDTWRRYDSDDPTSAADFEATYRRLLAQVDGATRLVLVEPFLLPVTEEQRGWLADLDPKRAVVARLAAERGAALVPLHTLLTDAAAAAGAEALAPDGVHPTSAGARLIADAWLTAYGRPA
ncbi:SGNH/GDSL hydrolase family protein [Isoptericola sp. NEAU-Y5]|uniref:SGNH/GDSL hydrolase family protein n=1 Tax=Isoptericola luteus TaxID=2879484 RepID=A0ABS7ZBW8_9MICO|nr:SGNH/GDSL hydrolase family protein [Isoptericola sp. NEAU-Y5]MCA5891952.1 SGNH/GDSL hydrolase family protein [Isoptericola sp. NEAU-Y5]